MLLFIKLLMTGDGKQCLVQMKINKKGLAPEEHKFCPEIRMTCMTT